MTIRIVFETHSTTEDNERGIATGWLPGRLSAAGRAQAAELARRRALAALWPTSISAGPASACS